MGCYYVGYLVYLRVSSKFLQTSQKDDLKYYQLVSWLECLAANTNADGSDPGGSTKFTINFEILKK